MENIQKSSSSEPFGLDASNVEYSIALWYLTKFAQMKVPGSKIVPRQGVLGSNHRNI